MHQRELHLFRACFFQKWSHEHPAASCSPYSSRGARHTWKSGAVTTVTLQGQTIYCFFLWRKLPYIRSQCSIHHSARVTSITGLCRRGGGGGGGCYCGSMRWISILFTPLFNTSAEDCSGAPIYEHDGHSSKNTDRKLQLNDIQEIDHSVCFGVNIKISS